MQISTDTYLFYEWLILEKKITEKEFKQLTVSEFYKLETEYKNFKQNLRGDYYGNVKSIT